MKPSVIVVALVSLVASAVAHTTVWGVWVNGVDQGDGRNVYVRSPPNNNPVKDLTSDAMACNVNNRRMYSVNASICASALILSSCSEICSCAGR